MFLKSNILRSPHAFATRNGGVSTFEHTKSLNLAFGRGDSDETVLENLKIFADAAGFSPEEIISRPQIHSDIIYKVGKENCGEGYFKTDGVEGGDGYITNERRIVLGVKAADCVPILFEAEKNGEIVAVGAVHAGWRGTVAGIAPKCVSLLCREYGASPENIRVAIGPCIHKCCYEVGADLYHAVEEGLGEEIAKAYVIKHGDKYLCDLPNINRSILAACGVKNENIDVIDLCTCCHPELFYSHRYSHGVRGTMLNVIYMS